MLGLIEQRQYLYFALYTLLSLVLGLVMVWAGREVVLRHV
jgi:fluoride ion exporter CrcB/FEX